MKVIIAGGRDYCVTPEEFWKLDRLHKKIGITEVVSGGASGADRDGELFAEAMGIPVKVFRPDWVAHGKSAGPRRNRANARDSVSIIFASRSGVSRLKTASGFRVVTSRVATGTNGRKTCGSVNSHESRSE